MLVRAHYKSTEDWSSTTMFHNKKHERQVGRKRQLHNGNITGNFCCLSAKLLLKSFRYGTGSQCITTTPTEYRNN